jgi:1,2-dihydroxy-3-keto-5-methylthiopentene dioxygenase
MKAYVYDQQDLSDQRAPHDSGIAKSVEDLKQVGVLYWRIQEPNGIEQIDAIAKERSYKNRDTVCFLPPRYIYHFTKQKVFT